MRRDPLNISLLSGTCKHQPRLHVSVIQKYLSVWYALYRVSQTDGVSIPPPFRGKLQSSGNAACGVQITASFNGKPATAAAIPKTFLRDNPQTLEQVWGNGNHAQ